MSEPFEPETMRVGALLPAGPRLAVIGSTQFWGADSAELCEAIADDLAGINQLVAMTGGMDGVGRTFADAWAAARRRLGLPENLFHLLPAEFAADFSGVTLSAGRDFFARREILGRVADVYLVIEGGPGTKHEAEVAAAHDKIVVPVGRTGGVAGELFAAMTPPPQLNVDAWLQLGGAEISCVDAAAATRRLVQVALATNGDL